MTDALKRIYEGQGALDRYFDRTIPRTLYRGQKQGSSYDIMQPTIYGFYKRNGNRPPDIHIRNSDNISPQFVDNDESQLIVDKKGMLTKEIMANSDQYMVRGCRSVVGNYRGVSVFHKSNPVLRGFNWFVLPQGTDLPPSLACTRDSWMTEKEVDDSLISIHYTIAAKDDMTLSLFLQELKALSGFAKESK
jgi:hypothetical protein